MAMPPRLGRGYREFESRYPDATINKYGVRGEMVATPGCGLGAERLAGSSPVVYPKVPTNLAEV